MRANYLARVVASSTHLRRDGDRLHLGLQAKRSAEADLGTRVMLSQVASLLLLDSRILAETELVLLFLHLDVNRKLF